MKAMRLPAFGGPETLVYANAPEPQPREGEVLVRVHATAITPTEFAWEPTWRTLTGWGPSLSHYPRPRVLRSHSSIRPGYY